MLLTVHVIWADIMAVNTVAMFDLNMFLKLLNFVNQFDFSFSF